MSPNIEALRLACLELGIEFKSFTENPVIAQIATQNGFKYFINCLVPLNTTDVVKIAKDKSLTYTILKDLIKQPKTLQFLDPNIQKEYSELVEFDSIDSIKRKVLTEFQLPIVIKMNSGERRRNLHFCKTEESIQSALESIFNKESKDYDYVAVVQEKINFLKEYRVVILDKEIELIYEKKVFKEINDESLKSKLQEFINPIFDLVNLEYGGLDIAEMKDGSFVLIELNTAPRYAPFIKKNGNKKIVEIYKNILKLIA